MAWNDYGLGEDGITLEISNFVWGFARLQSWNSDWEMASFISAAQDMIRWESKREFCAADFCRITKFEKSEFNELMSRMFYAWVEHIEKVKKN